MATFFRSSSSSRTLPTPRATQDIHHLSANSDIWLPEPYSTETAEKARGMNPFHSYAHHDLVFSAAKLIPSSRVQALVWKDYFYVPVVPRSEPVMVAAVTL